MAHELKPRNNEQLSAMEVAALLAKEFAYTRVDAEEGLKQARSRADWIERAPARVFLGHHQRALEAAAKLKNLSPGEALAIEFGNDQRKTLKAVVIPGEAIQFGYRSNEEQVASLELVERCARVLNCDVVVI